MAHIQRPKARPTPSATGLYQVAREIIVAVKTGGSGDPIQQFRLAR
jgi:transcriptional/translational regulatory protein YebC/TACO1